MSAKKAINLMIIAIVAMCLYGLARLFYYFYTTCAWYETLAASLFIAAELFMLTHTITYFFNVLAALELEEKSVRDVHQDVHNLQNFPPVAVILCSYKEPLDIVEESLICMHNLEYPNKQLYLLDDSPYHKPWDTPEAIALYKKRLEELCKSIGINLFRHTWRGAKAGMINDFLDYLVGLPHLGSQCMYFQQNISKEKPKYLVTFDADMNPLPTFLQATVAKIESDPNLAFVQTPQYYTNILDNSMADAAGIQQVVFYEYICKGKSLDKAVFCCGTNLIMRISTLLEVGGFDESCVTEDFATSLNIHLKGWDSAYLGKVLAFGQGPTDLKGYFSQQSRWAHGTLDVGRKTVFEFFKDWTRLPVAKWWSYFISCSYYLCGIVFLILLSMPCLFIFFNIKSFLFNPHVYMIICVPFILINFLAFILTLRRLDYKTKDILQTMNMLYISFPQITVASFRGMFKMPLQFLVTPKGKDIKRFSLFGLWPQVASCLLCAAAVSWGFTRSYYGDEPFLAIVFNVVWLMVHIVAVSPLIFFNNPVKVSA